ncbi:MAG: SDR family NAD(P)-dependent oxidoreductase [Cyclobacteriaceae bacterium]|nr:SDR family NAD(P)-dependent oxidoreductase [Cyclobacteriaceae bacterium HetDA_MAG_MS6]
MTPKTILITGATDGLGKALANSLAKEGHTLLLHGRSNRKLAETAKDIAQQSGNKSIRTYKADFASLKDVRQMADVILQNEKHLDVLVNNAGIGAGKSTDGRALNENGYELRFTVNYLSTFLLTNLLLPLMKKSREEADDIRIVNVASVGQRRLSFDDLMLEHDYSGINAYSQSKLAMIMYSFDLANELKPLDISVNALHPATLMPTKMTIEAFGYGMASVNQGVEATKRLITSSKLKGVTGKYFDGTHESQSNRQAYDESARKQLKEQSLELVDLVASTL